MDMEEILEMLAGAQIESADSYTENKGANVNGSEYGGKGVSLTLIDGKRIDIGVDFYTTEFYVREVE